VGFLSHLRYGKSLQKVNNKNYMYTFTIPKQNDKERKNLHLQAIV
jgi:hypothetical protein